MSDANTSAGDLTRSLSGAIQSHPLPAALIGMGLVWLFSSGKSLLGAGGGEAGESSSARKEFSNTASTGASNSKIFSAARSNLTDLMHSQPLALGAIGLGIGAAMASALPSTSVETDLMGQTSADLQARTRKAAGDMTDRVANLADNVTSAITKEAESQGLTPDSLKQSMTEAGRKVQNVADQSAERLRTARRSDDGGTQLGEF